MKIKSLLIGMLACSAMVACTNTDEPEVNNGEESRGDSYLSVKLVNPTIASRAFEDGEGNESKVANARFYLFDAKGDAYIIADKSENPKNSGKNYVDAPVNPDYTKNGNVETLCEAVIVINKSEKEPPASIVAILNPPTDVLGEANKKLSELQHADMAKNYATYKPENGSILKPYIGENLFVMTNSVHIDANNEMLIATPIAAENIKTSEGEAKAKPVEIFVERIASKVRVKAEGDKINVNENIVTIPTGINDANGKAIIAQIKGWKVTNITPTSNLIKSLNKTYSFINTNWTIAGWNDATNHRSYWANTTATPEHNWTFNDLTNSANGGVDYYNENTLNTPGSNSQLLVAAEFLVDGTKTTIAEWYGVKYTLDDLKKAVAGTLTKQIYVKDTEGNLSSISKDYIDFVQASDNETIVEEGRYKSFATYLVKDATGANITYYDAAGKALDGTTLNSIFANVQSAKLWAAGGYYYVDIKHHTANVQTGEGEDAKTEEKNEYALVRNHLYDIKITALSGLGTPVYDPNKIITPEKPKTDLSYIAARINVLAWKVVSQNVTLK